MRNVNKDSLLDLRLYGSAQNSSNSAQLRRLRHQLLRAMDRELTPRQRQMIHLRYYENMSSAQIARELDLCPSTVCRTLQRATARLHRALRYAAGDA